MVDIKECFVKTAFSYPNVVRKLHYKKKKTLTKVIKATVVTFWIPLSYA
jgi:dTDP-4-dehydrorhamnose 3,5-epimerase-like enzyme